MSFEILIGILVICITAVALYMATPKMGRFALGRHGILHGEAPQAMTPRLRVVPDDAVKDDVDTATPTVSVVIPTLNEEGSLPWVLEQLPAWVDELILVDGLSTDATQVLARRYRPVVVVVHQFRRGKGAALRAGFAAATGDIVVMLDADGSTDPREMGGFIGALRDGADFVKGSRRVPGGGSADFTRIRSAGNRSLVRLANILYRSQFTDLCYGYIAFWREHLTALAVSAEGFEIETELVLGALRAGLEIREIPSHEHERRAGVSNLNATRDGIRILHTMLRRRRAGAAAEPDFALQPFHLPVWRSDAVPEETGERRRVDRRIRDPETAGYSGPERRQQDRRETVGTVVAYRAIYGRQVVDAPPAEVASLSEDRAAS
jgi:hypothetical protein